MEDIELKKMWALLNDKQDMSLKINQKILENTTYLSVKTHLGSMRPIKIFTIIIGLIWVIFLDVVIINTFGIASWFFTASALIQVLISKIAIGVYVYQLISIQQIDISESILKTQKRLSEIKSSTIWITRLSFLQLPVWSTFYLYPALFKSENLLWLIFQAIGTSVLTYLSIWLFINIKIENKDKKWFKFLFRGKDWSPVIKSMELMDELADFRK